MGYFDLDQPWSITPKRGILVVCQSGKGKPKGPNCLEISISEHMSLYAFQRRGLLKRQSATPKSNV